MRKVLVAAILAIGAGLSSGCGTVCNLAGGFIHPDEEPKVYGGVTRDVEILNKMDMFQPSKGPGLPWVVIPLMLADPILSFVGDSLTLPLTAYLQNKRDEAEKAKMGSASDSDPGVTLGPPVVAED